MTTRATKTTEYIRHNFSEAERLQMGTELAQAHNKLADIDSEESVIKAQFKERRGRIEQSVGMLSRNLATGFEFRNIPCVLKYDDPKANEVSYYREDTNEFVKARAMTKDELQEELDFNNPIVVVPPEKSAENITEFFGKQDATAADQPEPIEDPEEKTGPGSEEFEQQVRESLGAPEPLSAGPRMVGNTPREKRNGKRELAKVN